MASPFILAKAVCLSRALPDCLALLINSLSGIKCLLHHIRKDYLKSRQMPRQHYANVASNGQPS